MTAREGDLAGRGPLGQKAAKPEAKQRKPMRRVSRKRAEYLASPERVEGKTHMANVAMLHCLVCGAWPVEVHHEGTPRSDKRVLPLCPRHTAASSARALSTIPSGRSTTCTDPATHCLPASISFWRQATMNPWRHGSDAKPERTPECNSSFPP